MDSEDEVAARCPTLDLGPAAAARPKKVPLDPATARFSATLALSAPGAEPTQVRPARLVRRRTTRRMGHAPRRGWNARTRGSRRVRAGPSSDDDPHEDGESDGAFSRPLSLGVG